MLVAYLSFRDYLLKPSRPKCDVCGGKMKPVHTRIRDSELSRCHKIERRIGSAKFERLQCTKCPGPRKIIWRHERWLSSASMCPSCDCKSETRSHSIMWPATEYTTGKRQVTEKCACCGKSRRYSETIPKRKRKRTSSSSSGSSGGGWGGGSSGGGGAGSSWLVEPETETD